MEQGFQPAFTIADGGAGLRAGQKEVLPNTPCHGVFFHLQQQFETVVNLLNRQAAGATSKRLKLEQKLAQAQLKGQKTRSRTWQVERGPSTRTAACDPDD